MSNRKHIDVLNAVLANSEWIKRMRNAGRYISAVVGAGDDDRLPNDLHDGAYVRISPAEGGQEKNPIGLDRDLVIYHTRSDDATGTLFVYLVEGEQDDDAAGYFMEGATLDADAIVAWLDSDDIGGECERVDEEFRVGCELVQESEIADGFTPAQGWIRVAYFSFLGANNLNQWESFSPVELLARDDINDITSHRQRVRLESLAAEWRDVFGEEG